MREVKFRAWNGTNMEHNVMAGWLGAYYVKGIDENDSACMSTFNTHLGSSPLMQFTGLKDKGGKEIYEGDVVAHKILPSSVNGSPTAIQIELRYEVVWWQGDYSGSWKCRSIAAMPQLMDFAPDLEVIGNIYENPDLIRGK